MTPNGIRALGAAAGLLAFTSMDSLEVIDVTIRLIEVAIAIIVIAIPDIELGQIGADLSRGLAGCDLGVIPGIDRITDKQPGAGTNDAAAIVGAIVGFIEWNLTQSVTYR